jgi:ProP effector
MHSEPTQAPTETSATTPEAPPQPERVSEPGLSPAECGARLSELFPALFVAPGAPGPFKPIKLRIHADILERAPGVFSKRVLGIFFSRYTTSNGYLKALVADGAQRFDLDGQPAGTIADEHRAAAVEELARRHAVAAERRAALRKAAPLPPAEPQRERPPRAPRAHPSTHADVRREDERARPPRLSHPQRPPRDPRAARPAPHAQRPSAPPSALPREAPAPALPADPARRERALLLRAFETSPLSKANFCVLKRIAEAELDALLEQARGERSAA